MLESTARSTGGPHGPTLWHRAPPSFYWSEGAGHCRILEAGKTHLQSIKDVRCEKLGEMLAWEEL